MVKEKRILSYILGWFIVGFIIIFMGVNSVFAATYYLNYEYKQQYYNNHGSNVEAINTTWNESLQSYISENIPTTANSYGAGLSISSPIPIITNHTYTISFYFEDINNINLSSKNNIAIGMSLSAASGNYASNNFWAETIQSSVKNNSIIQYVFKANGGADYIFIPWTTKTSTSQSYVVTQIIMEDLGSEGLSQEQINTSLNNQTNELNNSIQSSTNIITGEIDDMEQNIIDSNKETQEVIKDQFNTCIKSNNLFNAKLIPSSTGIIVNDNGSVITMPIVSSGNGAVYTTLKLSQLAPSLKVGDNVYLNFKRIPAGLNELIYLRVANMSWYNNTYKTITQEMLDSEVALYANRYGSGETEQVYLYDFMMSYNNTKFEPYGEEKCTNRIDETNDKLNNLQGALTDSSAPNTSGLENSAGWLPPGPLDSILNLPLTMLNSLTNSLGKTCSPLNLTLPYIDKNIQIPCLSAIFAKITGVNGLWSWVGTIASVLILYNYLLNLYAWVDRILTLRAEFDEAMGADMANWGRL